LPANTGYAEGAHLNLNSYDIVIYLMGMEKAVTLTASERKERLKNLLKRLTSGESVEQLKREFRELLDSVSPLEIPLIEQELVAEGVPISDILKMCDLHVELFRETLLPQELRDVPPSHPLGLLIRENEEILKLAEALSMYAGQLQRSGAVREAVKRLLGRLVSSIRRHYVKNQMLLFPYLERMGLEAVPRVLWGKDDEALLAARRLIRELDSMEPSKAAEELRELSMKVSDLVFRENKILYPTLWALLSPREWAAVEREARKLGYIVEAEGGGSGLEGVEPVYPYEFSGKLGPEAAAVLPREMRGFVGRARPDEYRLRRPGDIDLGTGFLRPEEIAGIFSSLPLEVTYADAEGRVRFYSESRLMEGFPRTRTILGRKIEYCHPPRLEGLVKKTVEKLRRGEADYEVFWTRIRGRIVRVLISAVRDREGRFLGVLETVEDFTDVLENPEAVKEKIVVL